MEPYQFPVKYQEVETVDVKQVVINKVRFVEENDRLQKVVVLSLMRNISNDIDKLNGLMSTEFAKRFMAMQVDPGKGICYERIPISDRIIQEAQRRADSDEEPERRVPVDQKPEIPLSE